MSKSSPTSLKSNSDDLNSYDLIVIGAGSAGFSASITAADAGKRVALIGYGTIGGTCVNVGCVPSKTLIRAAQSIYEAKSAAKFAGISGHARIDDWAQLTTAKDDLVRALRTKKYTDLLPEYEGVDYFEEGAAKLVKGGVQVNHTLLRAPKIIIATGGRPDLPPISNIENIETLDSTGLLDLKEKPESLIFIGGGYIGSELALMMARFGVKVTVVCRSHLLPGAEPEISAALADSFRAENIRVHSGVVYDSCHQDENGVTIRVQENGHPLDLSAKKLVITAGRRANSDGMDLEQAGVATDDSGAIIVGDDMQTSKPGIYAAGDVTNRDQFVYMAAYGAKIAAKNAVLGENNTYSNGAMPWVVFTDPQIAGVGLSEADAIRAGYAVKTSLVPLDQVPRALAARDTRGMIKLIADKKTDRLLGGQIMAPEGADSIQTLAMALKSGMTTKDLGQTLFPYLTNVEGLKLAAQTFDMDVAKLSCCAG